MAPYASQLSVQTQAAGRSSVGRGGKSRCRVNARLIENDLNCASYVDQIFNNTKFSTETDSETNVNNTSSIDLL